MGGEGVRGGREGGVAHEAGVGARFILSQRGGRVNIHAGGRGEATGVDSSSGGQFLLTKLVLQLLQDAGGGVGTSS